MNARELLDILHMAERLKDTPRHCTTSKGRTESVAEHSWRISLMAFLLRHEFPELDMDKVVDMCLIHDLGECFTGDIPTFLKTSADRETEDSLLDQWVKSLPAEVSADLAALYREMDAQETMESKVYKAMDKLEALIQHNESPLSTWSDNEYELNKTYAFDTVVFSDWLMNLRKEILADTLVKMETEKPLTKENISGIVELLMKELNDRVAEREIKIELTESARDYIIDCGYDPVYGARPLKRFLQKNVETLVARAILGNQLSVGDTVLIDNEGGELVCKKG